MSFKSEVKLNLFNMVSKSVDGKYLVIESDDWGSIRSSFKHAESDKKFTDPFLRFDRLECENDLNGLFKVLEKHKDRNGNPAVITANFVMRNPDFDSIKMKGRYKSERFFDTYNRYYGETNHVLQTILKGIEKKCFIPQLHALEHLNVRRWYADYMLGKKDVIAAFQIHMVGNDDSFTKDNIFGCIYNHIFIGI